MTTVHLENENAQLKSIVAKLQAQLLIERLASVLDREKERFSREMLEETIQAVVGAPR